MECLEKEVGILSDETKKFKLIINGLVKDWETLNSNKDTEIE